MNPGDTPDPPGGEAYATPTEEATPRTTPTESRSAVHFLLPPVGAARPTTTQDNPPTSEAPTMTHQQPPQATAPVAPTEYTTTMQGSVQYFHPVTTQTEATHLFPIPSTSNSDRAHTNALSTPTPLQLLEETLQNNSGYQLFKPDVTHPPPRQSNADGMDQSTTPGPIQPPRAQPTNQQYETAERRIHWPPLPTHRNLQQDTLFGHMRVCGITAALAAEGCRQILYSQQRPVANPQLRLAIQKFHDQQKHAAHDFFLMSHQLAQLRPDEAPPYDIQEEARKLFYSTYFYDHELIQHWPMIHQYNWLYPYAPYPKQHVFTVLQGERYYPTPPQDYTSTNHPPPW